ncbi:DODA-type extradiol aromatic ring-opening family dioxygenase [Halioxenophilus aromaticivorans]|uniref:Class III extradiol ring-cleavage dioxygenase n=1 Tax=Halioxenophilus aromaticivorans TaxID=1306992 RepID=A0AAV3TYN1_9ALTE
MTTNTNVLYLSHGGGPMPLMGDPGHSEMVACLQSIGRELVKPAAIIVISAHWEESVCRVLSAPEPPLLYDYYGFPDETYQIQYPCPGQPELATRIKQALIAAKINCELEPSRGFDHGVFVPLKLMFPQADIPCVQISLQSSLDAAAHLALGAALRSLIGEDILIVGSGFSFHNMRAFFSARSASDRKKNTEFEHWLQETCQSPELTSSQRWQRLTGWHQAPGARYCHPREEHLLPLHVCYGLAQQAADRAYQVSILNVQSSMYLWHL